MTVLQRVSALSVAFVLSACGSLQGHAQHGVDACTEFRQEMAGKSPEEQRRAAEAHIVRMHGSADAAHIERHLWMMEQRCSGTAPPRG